MSIVFSSDFNDLGTDWTVNTAAYKYIGQDNSPCMACIGNSNGQNTKTVSSSTGEGTIYFQFASIPGDETGDTLVTPGGPYTSVTVGASCCPFITVQSAGPSIDGIQLVLYLMYKSGDPSHGQIILRSRRGGSVGALGAGPSPQENPWYFASSEVTIHDGNWHGIQLSWVFDFGAQTLNMVITVDNVEAFNSTMTTVGYTAGSPVNLPNGAIASVIANQIGPVSGQHYIIENYNYDDEAQVIDWPGLVDAPDLTLTSCDVPTFVAVVTGLACVDDTIVITGTDFSEDASIDLQGPGPTVYTFDVVSISETEIVLNNLSPAFIPGLTCTTVTNPF